MTAKAGPSTYHPTDRTHYHCSHQQDPTPEEDEDLFIDLPTPIRLTPAELLERYSTINVLAPLVRCSKLPFRHLCSLYETHVTHTPMILAEEFSRSQAARVSDFSSSVNERGVFWMEPKSVSRPESNATREYQEQEQQEEARANTNTDKERIPTLNGHDRPSPPLRHNNRLPPTPQPPTANSELVQGLLLAQLASPNAPSLADASELISPYVDGVDINCGCPQKWAFHEGIGCALLRKPELVGDMIRVTKDRLGWGYPVSIKIRIDPEESRTEQLVSNAIAMGVSHITIHGRTRFQASTEPVNLPGLTFAVECVRGRVPTVANGDLWDLEDARKMRGTGVDGVMGARGLLANPALFAGYGKTPKHAIEQFINLSLDYGFIYPLFHKHLAYMLESRFTKPQRVYFNSLTSPVSAIDYLGEVGGVDIVSGRGTIWDAKRGRTLLV